MQPKPRLNLNFIKFLCGSSMVTIGVLMIVHSMSLFHYILNAAYSMQPGSFAFNMWRKYPMPLSIRGYFWNWTNPHEIYNHSVKPKFVEMGPYTFTEDKVKLNITWNDNNDTITYRQRRIWHFDPKNSIGSVDDKFTTINPTALSAAHKIQNWPSIMKRGFSFSLAALASKLHITKSVGETMFTGYDDPLMRIAKNMPSLLADDLDFKIDNKFGWFKMRNNSETFDGIFNMATGNGEEPLGELLRWKHQQYLKIHSGECSKVHGSSGEFYHDLEDTDHVSFFSPEICQNIKLDHGGEEEMFGILGKKFVAGPSFLDNGTLVPENKCFCDGECVPYGAVNASACRYGTPAFVTLPHFLDADQSYRDAVEGMKPDKKRHEFYLLFEPKSRIPLQAAARLQLTLLLHPVKDIKIYEKAPRIFFPVLWFEQVVELPQFYRIMLKILLVIPTIMTVTGSIIILIGIFIVAKTAYRIFSDKYSRVHNNFQFNLDTNAFKACDGKRPKDIVIRQDTFASIIDDKEEDPFLEETV